MDWTLYLQTGRSLTLPPFVPPGEVHPVRTVGLQPTPQLLWGDPAVVGPVAVGLVRDAGAAVPERGVASLRLVPAAPRQRHPHPGEAGHEEVGVRPELPELRQEHASALALAQVLIPTDVFLTQQQLPHIKGLHTDLSSLWLYLTFSVISRCKINAVNWALHNRFV